MIDMEYVTMILKMIGVIFASTVIYGGVTILISALINNGFYDDTGLYIGAWLIGGVLFVTTVCLAVPI